MVGVHGQTCSVCGMEGHNAKRCFLNEIAVGLPAAVEETQVSDDAGSVGAPVGASDGTPPAKTAT